LFFFILLIQFRCSITFSWVLTTPKLLWIVYDTCQMGICSGVAWICRTPYKHTAIGNWSFFGKWTGIPIKLPVLQSLSKWLVFTTHITIPELHLCSSTPAWTLPMKLEMERLVHL
jgi:hypothetical protein